MQGLCGHWPWGSLTVVYFHGLDLGRYFGQCLYEVSMLRVPAADPKDAELWGATGALHDKWKPLVYLTDPSQMTMGMTKVWNPKKHLPILETREDQHLWGDISMQGSGKARLANELAKSQSPAQGSFPKVHGKWNKRVSLFLVPMSFEIHEFIFHDTHFSWTCWRCLVWGRRIPRECVQGLQ